MSTDEFRTEQKSSVKISTTAAGKPLPEVKVYEGTQLDELEATRKAAVAAYQATFRDLGMVAP